MRLTYVGMMGLVFGLAVYGCSDDGGSSSGNTGGTDTGGGDTGGSDTGGGDTGGTGGGTGGSSTGGMGGSMGGMGGTAMGGMGGEVGSYETLEEACPVWCQVLDDLTGTECDDAFELQHVDVQGCIDFTCANEDYYHPACEEEWLAFVSCETTATQGDFQCEVLTDGENQEGGIGTAESSPCFELWQAADACYLDNLPQ